MNHSCSFGNKRELHFFEAHSIRHLHSGQFLFIIERRRPLLAHGLADEVTVHAIFALALLRALDAICVTRAVLLVALGFLAGAEFALSFLEHEIGL